MSLRIADVQRIEAAGHRDFYSEDADGFLRLKNVDGRCIFLDNGRCAVYASRPEGCVLYPMIYYTDCDAPGLHDFCPHRHEFRFSVGDRAWLCRGIAIEESEAAERVRRRGGSGQG